MSQVPGSKAPPPPPPPGGVPPFLRGPIQPLITVDSILQYITDMVQAGNSRDL